MSKEVELKLQIYPEQKASSFQSQLCLIITNNVSIESVINSLKEQGYVDFTPENAIVKSNQKQFLMTDPLYMIESRSNQYVLQIYPKPKQVPFVDIKYYYRKLNKQNSDQSVIRVQLSLTLGQLCQKIKEKQIDKISSLQTAVQVYVNDQQEAKPKKTRIYDIQKEAKYLSVQQIQEQDVLIEKYKSYVQQYKSHQYTYSKMQSNMQKAEQQMKYIQKSINKIYSKLQYYRNS